MDKRTSINRTVIATAKTLTVVKLLQEDLISFDTFAKEYICNYQRTENYGLNATIDWLRDLQETRTVETLPSFLAETMVDMDNYGEFIDLTEEDYNYASALWAIHVEPLRMLITDGVIPKKKPIPKSIVLNKIREIEGRTGIHIITDETEEYIQSMPQHYVDAIYNSNSWSDTIKIVLDWLDLRN